VKALSTGIIAVKGPSLATVESRSVSSRRFTKLVNTLSPSCPWVTSFAVLSKLSSGSVELVLSRHEVKVRANNSSRGRELYFVIVRIIREKVNAYLIINYKM